MGVFSNGWTVDAAYKICDPEAATENASLDDLSQLLDKSLVMRLPGRAAEQRFSMLETLREFPMARLEWREESQSVRERHTSYYRKLVKQAESQLNGPDQILWLDRLDQEQENLRGALQWLIDQAQAEIFTPGLVAQKPQAGPPEAAILAVQMAAGLASCWDTRGYYSEGRHWLAQVLAISEGVGASGEVRLLQARAKALNKPGTWHFCRASLLSPGLTLRKALP